MHGIFFYQASTMVILVIVSVKVWGASWDVMQIDDTQTDPHNFDSPNPSFNEKFESYRFRKSDSMAIRTKKRLKPV